jgi:nucleoside 2-deoxyribosyltransferase
VQQSRQRSYIASPFGFTEAGRDYYYRVYLPALSAHVDPVDPWSLTSAEELGAARSEHERRALALEIGRRNQQAIHSCTMLIACLDGQEPDCGTASEIGYAAALGMRCFGVRTDWRQSGEAGVLVNAQLETFIVDSGGEIAESLEALLALLATLPARGVAGAKPTARSNKDPTAIIEEQGSG